MVLLTYCYCLLLTVHCQLSTVFINYPTTTTPYLSPLLLLLCYRHILIQTQSNPTQHKTHPTAQKNPISSHRIPSVPFYVTVPYLSLPVCVTVPISYRTHRFLPVLRYRIVSYRYLRALLCIYIYIESPFISS
jgi:hypothetical protein